MPQPPEGPNAERQRRDAHKALNQLHGEPGYAGSSLAAAGRRAAGHFSGRKPGENAHAADPIELWGRRIGRALSLIGVVALAAYLYLTYLR
jgi:hypothetical protein